MKQCTVCGAYSDDREVYCKTCGAQIAHLPPVPPPSQQQPGRQEPPAAYPQTPSVPPVQRQPQMMQAPPPWYPLPFGRQKPFTWADIGTVLGFAASIIGYFWASVLLLPLGLVASIVGFRGDRTRGLAVAGIVISAIGLLIKLMAILYEATWLPAWFTNGIW